jgi:oxalate decarboxylase/phosphoglucose isomerase-like protein (cupin superfamily)
VSSQPIDPSALPTMTFDWGVIKPLVAGVSDNVSLLQVVLFPGQGHRRHNHPGSDEILHVLAGTGEQMIDDATTFDIRPGHTVWIPKAAFHSTRNTGWEPLVLLAVYAPGGAENALKGLPDYRELPPGEAPTLSR